MREYETTFIVQPEISEEGCQELFERIDGILSREGAERLLHDDQGKRRMAYEIDEFQKGRYVTTYYFDEGKAVGVLERALRLEESVLRFLTVMKEDSVSDLDARRTEAKEQERVQAERARERAEREADEERQRQEARVAAEAEAARRAAAEAEAAEAAPGEASAADGEADAESEGGESAEAAAPEAASEEEKS